MGRGLREFGDIGFDYDNQLEWRGMSYGFFETLFNICTLSTFKILEEIISKDILRYFKEFGN